MSPRLFIFAGTIFAAVWIIGAAVAPRCEAVGYVLHAGQIMPRCVSLD